MVKHLGATPTTFLPGYCEALPRTQGDRHLIALARFFGVSPAYFFPESETARGEVPAEVAVAVQDDQIRDIALNATGLSSRSLKTIRDMVDNARALEQPAPARRGRPRTRARE